MVAKKTKSTVTSVKGRRIAYAALAFLFIFLLFYFHTGKCVLYPPGPIVNSDGGPWIATVERGDLVVLVRGQGELVRVRNHLNLTARTKIPESRISQIRVGQSAEIDLRAYPGVVAGHVARIGRIVSDGSRDVYISFDRPLPSEIVAGAIVDGTVTIETLHDVLYVGRPVHANDFETVAVYKCNEAGDAATRVEAKFGKSSINKIQVLGGLNEGDRIIVSDMSRFDVTDRVELR